jgi:hypothetical protein
MQYALIMEAVRTSEMSVYFNETTRRCIPEDFMLAAVENPKFHKEQKCMKNMAVMRTDSEVFVLFRLRLYICDDYHVFGSLRKQ